MQQVESQPTGTASPQRTLRLAWLTILGFAALFVALLTWAGLTTRGLYLGATRVQDATLFVRGPAESISWRPADRTIFQGPNDQQQALAEGDTVRIAPSAGYGQMASVRLFDDSQLDLWAAAEVTLNRLRTTRWHSGTLDVELTQQGGYVRYDVKPLLPYSELHYRVRVGDATVELAPGGSYSIEMRDQRRQRRVERLDRGNTMEVDVAVRSGTATVYGVGGAVVVLRERQRVLVDPGGNPGLAVPARWELVRDGGFSQYSEAAYNNATSPDPMVPRADTWRVYGIPNLPPENRGLFRLAPICRPPAVSTSYCAPEDSRTAAWFYRVGGQTSGFTTGVEQILGPEKQGVDISEFRSLRLSLWARVLNQSLSEAGDRGSECPVMVRLLAKRESPDDPEEQRVVCIYVDDNGPPPSVQEPGIQYVPVDLAAWTPLNFDLRSEEWLPDYRYLRSIQIYANGHDYDSRVAEVSLVGEQ